MFKNLVLYFTLASIVFAVLGNTFCFATSY